MNKCPGLEQAELSITNKKYPLDIIYADSSRSYFNLLAHILKGEYYETNRLHKNELSNISVKHKELIIKDTTFLDTNTTEQKMYGDFNCMFRYYLYKISLR